VSAPPSLREGINAYRKIPRTATDVLGGLLVGVIAAVLGYLLMKLVMKIKGLEKVDAAKLFKKAPSWITTRNISLN
jgi:H+/Cl- antiporter ClcA